MNTIFIYGPPASGKSSYGRRTAEALGLAFIDLDQVIEEQTGRSIPDIFREDGETAFRDAETAALASVCERRPAAIVALGGGTLLRSENRVMAERAGMVVCLRCSACLLTGRVAGKPGTRPLADTEDAVSALLEKRREHYESFPLYIEVTTENADTAPDDIQAALGRFYVRGMGSPYAVAVAPGAIDRLAETLAALDPPPRHLLVVGDSNTLPLFGDRVIAACGNIPVCHFTIPAGETTKTMDTVTTLWQAMSRAGIERTDAVIAVGGGVTGDLTGFAAATWLRGVRWVNLPTTLLAMVDAGIGGKTGADLPQGKNLIGAFHPPAAVLCDTTTLLHLPRRELLCGVAESYKHALIGDPGLIPLLTLLPGREDSLDLLTLIARRSLAVKIRAITADPYERTGIRAALNLGHTLGHAVEAASGFDILHGEAVAVGLVAAAKIAARMGFCSAELPEALVTDLAALGLPFEIPARLDRRAIREALLHDKKKAGGTVQFVLPIAIGQVQTGCAVPPEILDAVLNEEENA